MMIGASGADAMTIGNVRGAVLVGKPVNVTVPVTLDAGETVASSCTEVEISFADSRIDSSRVRTSWLAPDAKGETSLRIQSTIPVDEPMINIWLRAGCLRKSERRFVLLADVVTEPAPTGPVVVDTFTPAPPIVSAVPQVLSASPRTADPVTVAVVPEKAISKPVAVDRPSKTPAPSIAVSKPAPAKVVAEVKSAKLLVPTPVTPADESSKSAVPTPPIAVAVQPVKPKDESVEPKARLRLEGLPNVSPGLKPSMTLSMPPSEDLKARENARTIWQSLNVTPDEVINNAKRLALLESEALALRESKAKVAADQTALKSQLERAEEERYSNWLVGLLGSLLVGASAVAGIVWWRSRKKNSWSPKDLWHGGDSVEPSNLSDLAPVDSGMSGAMPLAKQGRSARRASKAGAPDIDLGVDESLFDSLKTSALQSLSASSRLDSAPPTNGRAFMNSMSARTVNVEELFDLQQQAEFFVSLGQHEQAIELLRQHIYTNSSTSGIAYLDLLKIYHDLDRRSEYEHLREEFNQSFNAKVPPFDKFGQLQRRGLERYPSAMARIEALWKSPRILAILQESIFRRPEAGDAECFDLEAYRELLMLFSIAKEVSGMPSGVTTTGHKPMPSYVDSLSANHPGDEVEPPPASKSRSSRFRSSQSFENSVSVTADDAEIPVPKPSPRLALDVNLFELESVLPGMEQALATGAELSVPVLAERSLSASPSGGTSGVNTMNVGLSEQSDAAPSLPALDFSLSLPAEFSTASPAPAMSPKVSPPPQPSSLALDLNKYMAQKDVKAPDSGA